jgi:Ca-activated chloride channel family protein
MISASLRRFALLAASALLALPTSLLAQGIVIDRRPHIPIARAYEVREVSVDARIRDQVAEVQVSQTFHNPGSFQIDAEYLFPLPEEGAIQNFVLLADGKELPGRLIPKDEARRIYEEIVRTKRDPALLEYMGRGLFRTSVFPIPPGADRKLTMRYTQICKRDRDVVEFSYPFSTQKFTAKPIHRLSLSLRVESKDSIKSLYSPTYDAVVSRPSDHEASVRFEQQQTIPSNDFRLIYSLAEGSVGASVLSYRPSESEDGYFLLLASPQVKREDARPRPKTVIFVLDRSGSMAGKKIEQARNALKFVLNNLRDDDTFNIVAYDDRVETFKPELERYGSDSRNAATRFVDNIREGGGTNIDAALRAALGMIHDDSRPGYILFLTDGLPTVGEVKETAIAANTRSSNKARARIFAFGVGYDVNARLLDRLSGGNSGTSEYVRPDEDIESHVSRFYSRLTSPALANIQLEFTGTDINRTYPRDIPDLFEGSQLVLAGRYRNSGRSTLRVTGRVGGDRQTFEVQTDLARAGEHSSQSFVETLWATRRVGDLIDQIDLNGPNKELIDELVALSTRYGILTPYTSFLADERVSLLALSSNTAQARKNLEALHEVSGPSGVAQRGLKQRLMVEDKSDSMALGGNSPARAGGMGSMMMGGRGMGGMGGGMGGLMGGTKPGTGFGAGAAVTGGAPRGEAEARENKAGWGESRDEATVRRVGSKTFFRKGKAWVDSTLKPDDESKAVVIRQFSDAFFEMARNQKPEFNQYLTFEEPVTVKIDSQVYRFEQAAK